MSVMTASCNMIREGWREPGFRQEIIVDAKRANQSFQGSSSDDASRLPRNRTDARLDIWNTTAVLLLETQPAIKTSPPQRPAIQRHHSLPKRRRAVSHRNRAVGTCPARLHVSLVPSGNRPSGGRLGGTAPAGILLLGPWLKAAGARLRIGALHLVLRAPAPHLHDSHVLAVVALVLHPALALRE